MRRVIFSTTTSSDSKGRGRSKHRCSDYTGLHTTTRRSRAAIRYFVGCIALAAVIFAHKNLMESTRDQFEDSASFL
jgi:hypothetical protein